VKKKKVFNIVTSLQSTTATATATATTATATANLPAHFTAATATEGAAKLPVFCCHSQPARAALQQPSLILESRCQFYNEKLVVINVLAKGLECLSLAYLFAPVQCLRRKCSHLALLIKMLFNGQRSSLFCQKINNDIF
jgi:hypothetical protein